MDVGSLPRYPIWRSEDWALDIPDTEAVAYAVAAVLRVVCLTLCGILVFGTLTVLPAMALVGLVLSIPVGLHNVILMILAWLSSWS